MAKPGRPPTCECGDCQKCKARVYMRGWTRRNTAKVVARKRRWRHENPDKLRAQNDRHAERYPEKTRARRKVQDAIRSGRIVRQPCEACGATPAQAHHDDYSKPLDVRWLCRTHHGEEHRST